MDNFNIHTPKKIIHKLQKLKNDLLEQMPTIASIHQEDISGLHSSGYIPVTAGGYAILYITTNTSLSVEHQKYRDSLYKTFVTDYGHEYREDSDDLKEAFDEYISEDVYAMVKYYLFSKGEDIHIQVRLSYTDTPYHRDEFDEIAYHKIIPHKDLPNIPHDDILKEVTIYDDN